MSRPKIVLSFFGIPRNSHLCWPSITENIIAPLSEKFDVVPTYHLYMLDALTNARSNERGGLDPSNYAPFLDHQGKIEAPNADTVQQDVADLKLFGDAWGDNFASLRNLVHQLHSLNNVTLTAAALDPDVVIYLRPDLLYHDPIDPHWIKYLVKHPDNVLLPNWAWAGGYNDRLALCGRLAYRAYGQRISRASQFCRDQGTPLHAERLLRYALRQAGVKVKSIGFKASRVRLGGEVVTESFTQLRRMGSARSVIESLATRY